ncbi:ABC transporter permease [Maioricimonas sp. JC845]|uniref:ABC transporter permease n=1 Tax=Maioricimonas sp. JC845 TaxID=3232138 RepID=UPI00345A0FD1
MVNELFLLAADETLVAASRPVAPYVVVLWGAAVLIVGLLLFNYLTRAGTIARATIKEAVRQPVFLLLLGTSALIILANTYVPFFSMGDDTKMFMDCGLATILICSLLLSVWTASISVADEIEGKTAMTLLSKPITRRQFIVGKYLGIVQGSLLLILISGAIFFVFTYYKFGYDYRESGKGSLELFNWTAVSWAPFEIPMPLENRLNASLQILPGLALIFMEMTLMTGVSVAISTRLPMLVNIVSCFAIFVIGHLTPVLVRSALKDQVFVKFVAQLLATILPSLDNFNMSAAVATGKVIPADYIGLSAVYCVAYALAAMLLAFILFEDRDLA